MNATPIRHYQITRSLSNGAPEAPWQRLRLVAVAAPVVLALLGLAAIAPDAAVQADAAAATAVDPTQQRAQRYADAVEAFRDRHYAVAYGRFAALADDGHVPSAHVALVMLRQGHAMFGSDWSATPGQQARWTAMVANTAHRLAPMPGGEHRE